MQPKEIKTLLENKNFLNSQSYILSKKLINNTKKWMSITKWKWIYEENLIWFDHRLKIQKILISQIKLENSKLKYQILWFDLLIILWFTFAYIENWFQREFIFIILFLIIFTIPWFINFNTKEDYLFYKDRNSLIIYKK